MVEDNKIEMTVRLKEDNQDQELEERMKMIIDEAHHQDRQRAEQEVNQQQRKNLKVHNLKTKKNIETFTRKRRTKI